MNIFEKRKIIFEEADHQTRSVDHQGASKNAGSAEGAAAHKEAMYAHKDAHEAQQKHGSKSSHYLIAKKKANEASKHAERITGHQNTQKFDDKYVPPEPKKKHVSRFDRMQRGDYNKKGS